MKATYKELMDKLGVGRPLSAYDAQPWLIYDSEKNMTAMAEVRSCDGDQNEVEAEIQFMPDTPLDDGTGAEQISLVRCQRLAKGGDNYTVTSCVIRGEEWKSKFFDWETKSCNFFRACVREIKAGKLPDIDAILSKEMKESGFYGRNQGDGSNKQPKINANQLMYDRKGIGAGF